MLRTIFEWLSQALHSAPIIAMLGSFIWGVLSILLSPCHLASIPLIVGFISGQEKMSTRRAFWLATLFSLGILTTIAIIGVVTGLMGRMLGDIGTYGYYFVAGIFFIVGLYLLEVISIPFLGNVGQPKFEKKGSLAALILGLAFGVALGPCTFAYMAPMLAIAFSIAATQFLYGVILLIVYGIGHCSVIVVAGTSTELVQRYLNWNAGSKGVSILKRVCAVLIILAGVYLIWIA